MQKCKIHIFFPPFKCNWSTIHIKMMPKFDEGKNVEQISRGNWTIKSSVFCWAPIRCWCHVTCDLPDKQPLVSSMLPKSGLRTVGGTPVLDGDDMWHVTSLSSSHLSPACCLSLFRELDRLENYIYSTRDAQPNYTLFNANLAHTFSG